MSAQAGNVWYMQHFVPLALMGVRVVKCPDLGRDSVYFHRFNLLVVDANLSDGDAERVACHALGLVAQHLAAA